MQKITAKQNIYQLRFPHFFSLILTCVFCLIGEIQKIHKNFIIS